MGNNRRTQFSTRAAGERMKASVLIFALILGFALVAAGSWHAARPSAAHQPTTEAGPTPSRDVRLDPGFISELTAYKKGFRLPGWAAQGRARQIDYYGGPMFAACQIESGWPYLTDPKTPGFVGMIRSVWTLTNLYTDDIERRLDEMHAAAYNWVIVNYQLGFAFEDEARQRTQVRRLIQLAHARGMHVTTYFSLTSIFTNSAFVRNPQSKDWVQENADGTPIRYAGIPIRLMACVNKPGRLEYLKRIVRLAVEDGTDDIFWDSIFNRCYCSYCERGFREYSKRVLGREYPIPRTGQNKANKFGVDEKYEFSGLSQGSIDTLFTEYPNYAVAKAIAELDQYAKSINPAVLVSANSHRLRYVDDVADITFSEDAKRQGGWIDEKGKLVTPIGVYQWCQAAANGRKTIQLTVAFHDYYVIQPPEYYQQTAAEAAAFQANFVAENSYEVAVRRDDGDPIAKRAWEGVSRGLGFIAANPAVYERARPVADVGIYYSYPTRLRPDLAKQAGISWTEVPQNFMLAGVPTRMVTDDAAVRMGAKELLAQNKALVLAGAACLSNEEVRELNAYAELGGKLLITPDTGSFTSFWTKRPSPPWSANSFGVRILSPEELSSPAAVRELTTRVLERPPLLTVAGNGYQLAVPTAVDSRVAIHLINYDRSRNFENLKLTIAPSAYRRELTDALKNTDAARWLGGSGGEELVPIVRKGDQFEIVVPALRVSGVLVIIPK